MRTILLDDDQPSLDIFSKYLREDSPEVDIIGAATSLDGARALLEKKPELAIFDIRLDTDGTTSFEFLKVLHEQDKLTFDVIFITAYGTQEYIVEALELSAIKFLTKPVNRKELRSAVLRALERRSKWESVTRELGVFLKKVNQPQPPLSSNIPVPLLNGWVEMVAPNAILCINSYQKATMCQCYLHEAAKPLISTLPIGKFEQLLQPHPMFFRIHESHIVNLNGIQRYNPSERSVLLKNGTVLYAASSKARELKKRLFNEADLPDTGKGEGLMDKLRRLVRV